MPFSIENDSDAQGKTSRTMPKMVREIFIQVREKVRESQGIFFSDCFAGALLIRVVITGHRLLVEASISKSRLRVPVSWNLCQTAQGLKVYCLRDRAQYKLE